jgi:hypothetical protein
MVSTARPPMLFHATTSNGFALDRDEKGGNPFASALIDVLSRPRSELSELGGELVRLTSKFSRARQKADVAAIDTDLGWPFVPRSGGESRLALVMVVSDYSSSPSINSLKGAAFDAERVAVALGRAGFVTQKLLDLGREAMLAKLADFAEASEHFDCAAIYTTGHGVEFGKQVFLLPGDIQSEGYGRPDYERRAVRLSAIAKAARARRVNLVFFGGCRFIEVG